ncbi:MAG: hypothetical protein ABIW82_14240 [Dokdonella sp.]
MARDRTYRGCSGAQAGEEALAIVAHPLARPRGLHDLAFVVEQVIAGQGLLERHEPAI